LVGHVSDGRLPIACRSTRCKVEGILLSTLRNESIVLLALISKNDSEKHNEK
jgi:hypothetical protein